MRRYSNIARPVQLAVDIDDEDTTIQVSSITGYPEAPFLLAIERGTAKEELLYCEATSDTPASFEVIRGYGGTTAVSHNVADGVLVEHVTAAIDHVESGVLPLTTAERDSLEALDPETGLGDLWTGKLIFNLDAGELQVYQSAAWRAIIPAGVVDMFAGSTPPPGWFLCDGSAKSRTDYARLFAVIGETWGPGNGSTTFNIPDFRGRHPLGVGGTPAQALGATGGTWNHTHSVPTTGSSGTHAHGAGSLGAASGGSSSLSGNLTTSSSGGHNHTNPTTQAAPNHNHSNPSTGSSGSHNHSFSDSFSTGGPSITPTYQAGSGSAAGGATHSHSGSVSGTTSSGGSHTHSTGDTGDGGAHSHGQGATSTASAHTHTVSLSGAIPAHTHDVTGSTANGGAHTHTFGSATGLANGPFGAINFIIRY